jgi:hypothetical protein
VERQTEPLLSQQGRLLGLLRGEAERHVAVGLKRVRDSPGEARPPVLALRAIRRATQTEGGPAGVYTKGWGSPTLGVSWAHTKGLSV